MALTSDQITAQNFADFYQTILPYLNGGGNGIEVASVVADGVKTRSQLLNDLYAQIDANTDLTHTVFTDGTNVMQLSNKGSAFANYGSVYTIQGTGMVMASVQMKTSGSVYCYILFNTSAVGSYNDNSGLIPPAGTVYKIIKY